MQVTSLKEKQQAHAKTACLGHTHCTLLRQQLMLNEEPAVVEAELCEVAAEQQQSVQVGKHTEPAAGAEAHGRWLTPDRSQSQSIPIDQLMRQYHISRSGGRGDSAIGIG